MAKKGNLYIISGPSGVGKSTILDAILRRRPELQYSISYTTRPPRGDEQDGVDYHFINEATFREKIEAGEFAEWAEVHGCLYGTSAAYLEKTLASGQDVLLDIDVQGAKVLFAKFPGVVSVFIAPPKIETLKERLRKRGVELPEAVERRMKNAEEEMIHAYLYDHVVVNDNLDQAISRLEAVIEEACRNG